MAISILLDRYNFPVVLPSGATSPESRSPLDWPTSPIFHPGPSGGPGFDQTSVETFSSGSPGSMESRPGEPTINEALPDTPLLRLHVPPNTPAVDEEMKRMSHLCGSTASPSSSCPSSSSSSAAPGSTASSQHSVRTSQSPTADLSRSATLVGSDRAHLKRFRKEQGVSYTSNLPHFLRRVDWLKRNAVEDVHWLLDHLEPNELELPVALELLSFDFIDESVRRLVVQRLESLSNDEVLKYLLQLVQVCILLAT